MGYNHNCDNYLVKTKEMILLSLPKDTLEEGIFRPALFRKDMSPEDISELANVIFKMMMKIGQDNIQEQIQLANGTLFKKNN